MNSKHLKVSLLFAAAALLLNPATSNSASEIEIENAINDGLTWLATTQQPDGSWWYHDSFPGGPDPAATAMVVLKFEERAKELGYENPFDPSYAYHTNVIAALDYLFGLAFDDGGGRISFGGYAVYTNGLAMMAVAASNTPDRLITTGAFTGWTYEQFLQGLQDWMVGAQNVDTDTYDCDVGGWGYTTSYDGWSDQSNSGYATLGLGFAAAPAPTGFAMEIPPSVLTLLDSYIDNVQDPVNGDSYDGGSWYEPCTPYMWVNILKTGNLLYEMALAGDAVDDVRVQDAIHYIEAHWTDTGVQPEFPATSLGWMDSYQAMFTLMKGFEAFAIDTIDVGGIETDWFDEVSDVIVANQNPAGYFEYLNTAITEGDDSTNLRTAWALLTLERVVPTVTIAVPVDIKPTSCPNPFNVGKKGVIPVAILGTEDFDVTQIDPASITLIGVSPLRWAYEDVATPYEPFLGKETAYDCNEWGPDGFVDLTFKFDAPELAAALGPVMDGEVLILMLEGNLLEEYGGTPFHGEDVVVIIKNE